MTMTTVPTGMMTPQMTTVFPTGLIPAALATAPESQEWMPRESKWQSQEWMPTPSPQSKWQSQEWMRKNPLSLERNLKPYPLAAGEELEQDEELEQEELEREMDAKYGPRSQRYDLRTRRARDYSNLFLTEGEGEEDDMEVHFVESDEDGEEEGTPLAIPQMSMKKGIKLFGQDGVAAVKKEILQLHERQVMAPKHVKELTPEQKQEALAYLMFL
jgi:hypothetical protein